MGQRRGTLYKAAFGLTGILLCLTVWFLYMAVGSNTQQLRVSFLDVGQGEAMLIETPSGTETLIDTGRSGSVSRPLSRRLPFYDRTMDMVIATHADSDHIGALPAVLADYRVGVVLPPAQTKSTAAWQAAAAAIQAERRTGVRLLTAKAGDLFRLGPETFLLTLSPTNTAVPADTNNSSLVFKLIHGDTSILFTGDISQSVERYLANRFGELLRADVLKVAHHGSDSSSAQMFLSAVSPQWAVISAGADNAYGHPDSTVIDRLQAAGATTVCTCDVGTVTFVSDGKEFEKTD